MLDWCDSLSRLSRLPLPPSRLSLSLSLSLTNSQTHTDTHSLTHTHTEKQGADPRTSYAIIWIFAVTLSAPTAITVPLWRLWREGVRKRRSDTDVTRSDTDVTRSDTDARSETVVTVMLKVGKVLLLMSAPWVGQIHLYGYAASSLLGEFGPAIGWPLLMSSTTTMGLLVGWRMGEWGLALPRTITTLKRCTHS
jgi:hypothetical protein